MHFITKHALKPLKSMSMVHAILISLLHGKLSSTTNPKIQKAGVIVPKSCLDACKYYGRKNVHAPADMLLRKGETLHRSDSVC